MKDDGPADRHRSARTSRLSGLTRKLSLPSRMRAALTHGFDRILGADLVWSAALVGVMFILLESARWGASYGRFQPGERPAVDVVATRDLEILDEELTGSRRRSAGESVPDVWALDTERGSRLRAEMAREIAALGLSREVESALGSCLEQVERRAIVASKALLDQQPAILVVRIPGGGEETVTNYASILDLDEARGQARSCARTSSANAAEERDSLSDLLATFVDANLSYAPEATSTRREQVAAAVPEVRILVPQGTVLARAGEKLTKESLSLLEAAREASERRSGAGEILGLLTVLSMLAFFLHRYCRHHQRRFRKIENLHALLALVLVLMMLLAQGMLWVVRGLADDLWEPFHHVGSYTYLIPLGGGAILVALLANGRIAMVYAGFASVLFSALCGWDALRMVWAFLVQLAGVHAITSYRERAALLKAGLVVGGAGAAAAVAIGALREAAEPTSRIVLEAGLAFLGGALGVGLLVSFVLPLFEGLFHVLTDIRLLELSNVNHPLLSELAVRAPGSYNHSLVVGTLAQEAAKTIGANSLFCRVAAFYHDIGKVQKPEYYVENQHGVNPHDRLSPSMSALVIAAHVKDGVRMAREAGLPEQIVDIIPQHHGTRLMTFFHDKARRQADPSLGPINEDDFRYPGPKPRTAEAAIFMLSDAVEAAARSVDEPTPNRLREVIRRVTNAIVLDRQLDDCDLTFADLERIQESLLRTLVGMHHHRPDYPGFAFGRRPREAPTKTGNTLQDRRMAGGS